MRQSGGGWYRSCVAATDEAFDFLVLGSAVASVMGGMMLWWLFSGWLLDRAEQRPS